MLTPAFAVGNISNGAVEVDNRTHGGRPFAVQQHCARSDQAIQGDEGVGNRPGRSADPPGAFGDVVAFIDGPNDFDCLHDNTIDNADLKRLRLTSSPIVVCSFAAARSAIDTRSPGVRGRR